MLVVGSNDDVVKSTKDMLKSKFDMNNIGQADVHFGNSYGFVPSQSHYIDKIREKFDKNNAKEIRTLIDSNQHLLKNKGESVP